MIATKYFTNRLEYTDEELCKYFNKGLILDLGSGKGSRSLFLQSKGLKTIAFDIDQSSLDLYSDKVKMIQGDMNNGLPFESGTFFGVLCAEVLEHTSTPGRVISEISRVLKEDGTLVITTPCLNIPIFRSLLVKIYRLLLQRKCSYEVHKQVFSTKNLCNLLQNKFKVVDVEYTRFTTQFQIHFGFGVRLNTVLQSLAKNNSFLQYFAQGNIVVCKKDDKP